jgi:hypothetical protein
MFSFTLKLSTAALLLAGCASKPTVTDNDSTMIDLKSQSTFKFEKIQAKPRTQDASYKFQNKPFQVEAIMCDSGQNLPQVAVINDDQTAFAQDSACDNWQAQVILAAGYQPLLINRPSFGKSGGPNDFSGPQSQAAIAAVIEAGAGRGRLVGIWGYGTGSISAGFAAKKFKEISWLLLGNGFYDLEIVERLTKDAGITAAIKNVKSSEGDMAFEKRSLAWDISDLPKCVLLYHSKTNDVAPKAQADALNDQLRTAQTRTFYDEIDGVNHVIPWQAHFQIVAKILKTQKSR